MRVLLLGATGSIGSDLLPALVARGHDVTALARSEQSAVAVTAAGAQPLSGDLRAPEDWATAVREVDAVIQVAATFTEDMGAVDRGVVEALIAAADGRPKRFLYTGGCWLFGATGDRVADEESPFDCLPSFTWMLENHARLRDSGAFDCLLLHPAMVYRGDGGVLDRFLETARHGQAIEVWGSPDTRWPLVHSADLAEAYCLALKRGAPGGSYCLAAEEGRRVSDLVAALSQRYGVTAPPLVRSVAEVVAEQGDWAAGPALDQQMSGTKARRDLGWQPQHLDVLAEIAAS
ncbi:MAG: NAD-dependent epimerase/dehydratase family protein [Pseudomonadota bacterium]